MPISNYKAFKAHQAGRGNYDESKHPRGRGGKFTSKSDKAPPGYRETNMEYTPKKGAVYTYEKIPALPATQKEGEKQYTDKHHKSYADRRAAGYSKKQAIAIADKDMKEDGLGKYRPKDFNPNKKYI